MSKNEKCPSAGCVVEPRFHAGEHRAVTGKTWIAHEAGCACGPCHTSRTSERTLPVKLAAANACGVKDGDRGRSCVRERDHSAEHFTGYRLFCDPAPPAPKKAKATKAKSTPKVTHGTGTEWKANLIDTGKTSDVETSEGIKPLRIVFSGDDVNAGRCGLTWDGYGAPCAKKSGHKGEHKSTQATWKQELLGTVAPIEAEAEDDQDQDPLEDEIRSDDERDFAREMREKREAHAAELERAESAEPAVLIAPTGDTITCRGRVYPVHPAARLFPTPEKQYRETVESIRRDGQKHEIELLDEPGNAVIDGCSRLRACEELGIAPRTKVIHIEPGGHIQHVIAVNLARRHLDESQRATAAAELATMTHGTNQHSRGPANLPVLTQAQAAELLHVSERSVRDAVRVKNQGTPEVKAAVREGRIRVSAGAKLAELGPAEQRELVEQVTKGKGEVRAGKVRSLVAQRQKREVVRKINEGQVPTIGMLTSGFGVALSDPAWPYDNSDQHEGTRGHIPYPGQPLDAIVKLHAEELPARMAEDSILFLCYTNAFFLAVADIARAGAWTLRTQLTIVKSRTGIGTWPRGRTEHVAILSRGNPTHTLNEISTWLADKVIEMPREHSRKPEELYQVIEKHCGGPRLELYSRHAREGWSAWGAEAEGAPANAPKRKSKILTATDARVGA